MKRKPVLLIFLVVSSFFAVPVMVMADAPGDIIYERIADGEDKDLKLDVFPPSIFQHWVHRINYRCDACHDSLFEMKRGGTPVTMDLMKKGKVCGACHNGETAFGGSFESCSRCHYVPEE